MNGDEHVQRLGKVVGNLQSLEFALRGALANMHGSRKVHPDHGVDVLAFPVGSVVPESDLTDYASLGKLVEMFNLGALASGGRTVNTHVVELRDALAHGRTYTHNREFPLRLVKFDKPRDGKVRVAYSEVMDHAWFDRQRDLLNDCIDAVRPSLAS
jgi:hypothetical protein